MAAEGQSETTLPLNTSTVATAGQTSGGRLALFWQRIRPTADEDRRVTMAKVSAWLHWLAAALALILLALPPTSPSLALKIGILAALAVLITVPILQIPWTRLPENVFLVVSALDIGLIGAGVAVSGGPESRYQLLFMLVVVFTAYFFRVLEVVLVTAICAAVYCSPLLYSHTVPAWSAPAAGGTLGVMILVAAVTKETVLRVERERKLRDQSESQRADLLSSERQRSAILQIKTRQLESILETGNAFRLQLGLDALLAKVASAICETGGFRAAVVRLFDPVSGAALCRAVYGVDWESMQPPTPPDFIASLMSAENRISRSYMMRIHQESFHDPEIKPYLYNLPGGPSRGSEWTPEHALIVPLETREHGLIGIISIDEPLDGKIPSIDTIQALEIFANLAATAIDNARLLEEASEAEALRQLDALKTEFLAAVSHDLRTPLTVIKGSMDLLELNSQGLSALQSKLIDGIGRNTQRLLDMVEELLELIQLEDGRINLERHLVDIWEVVWDTAESMAVAGRAGRQVIDVPRGATPIWVLMDRNRIQQVLTNLVSNACKYGPEDSVISVGVDRRQDEVCVSVHDQGPGIPPEEQRRIFEKFYRAGGATTNRVGGTGLGLAICRSLVELHGGRIWVDSRLGSGTTFTFSLPMREKS